MKKHYTLIAIAVGGAVVLALEILGTRILGPFYGVSIFLWSALLTVTLAALSIGYAVGGAVADRRSTLLTPAWILFVSGIWILLIPLMTAPVLRLSEPVGLRFAVLAAAAILFLPPLTLLGMLTPIVLRLRVSGMESVGKVSGTVFAVSTLASVVSALITGFYLIPVFGVRGLTFTLGILLLATAALGFILGGKRYTATVTLALILLADAFIRQAAVLGHAGDRQTIRAQAESVYAELTVLDNDHGRHLLVDGSIHSLVDTESFTSGLPYIAVMSLSKYYFDKPGKMLLIGLGGGSLAKGFTGDGWKVDAVEIDADVVALATRYFGLRPADAAVSVMDGRRYLSATRESYDLIMLDAFGSSSPPFHLMTQEAFALCAARLRPGGALSVNIEAKGWHDPIVADVAATLRSVFSNVIVFPIAEPPTSIGNIVLLASNRPLVPHGEPPRNETFDPDWRYGPGYQQAHAWDNQFLPDASAGTVLTDNLNCIDILAEPVNLAARKELHAYFREGDRANGSGGY